MDFSKRMLSPLMESAWPRLSSQSRAGEGGREEVSAGPTGRLEGGWGGRTGRKEPRPSGEHLALSGEKGP